MIWTRLAPGARRRARAAADRAATPGRPDHAAECRAIQRSGLFDAVWYAERTPEAASFPDPLTHYVVAGAKAGLAPHPLFDVRWYARSTLGFEPSGLSPLGHFVVAGETAGASASPLFDPVWYRSQDSSLASVHEGLFLHFLQNGAARGLSPHPAFDPAYYRSLCPDIAGTDTNPLTHFLEIGAKRGIAPNPFFDIAWYAAGVPALADSGENPLVHFLTQGAAEGRQPHPDIDLVTYQSARPDCPRDPAGAYRYLVTHEQEATFFTPDPDSPLGRRQLGLLESGLFLPRTYLELNEDLAISEQAAFEHFIRRGLPDARPFANAATIARLIARMSPELEATLSADNASARQALAGQEARTLAAWFRDRSARIGVFCSSQGNFYMRDIAGLMVAGLRALGIAAELRDENAGQGDFDLRVFVAPHEFFYLGEGRAWRGIAARPGSVLYNVEQPQSPWFSRAFQVLLKAPLILDMNFQTAAILRRAGFPAVHFMPGYVPGSPSAQPHEDVSDIELAQGYAFSRQRFNWRENDRLEDRPIDILFIGATAPRRDKALMRLLELTDDYRFLCVYRGTDAPLTADKEKATSARINCALAQRSKIVLNIYRDWLGYFDWSRIVQYGFWQGAGVVTDPSMAHPLYRPGVHFQEESVRHLGELMRWLLGTPDGRQTLDDTRRAGFAQARTIGSMDVALVPVLQAFKALLVA